MRWFGPSWGAPVCDPAYAAPTPTAPCAECGKAFHDLDQGVILPFHGNPGDPSELPYHHTCFMKTLGLYPLVHVLQYGFPLCGFSRLLPCDWPKGNTWVRMEEREAANCPHCKLALFKQAV